MYKIWILMLNFPWVTAYRIVKTKNQKNKIFLFFFFYYLLCYILKKLKPIIYKIKDVWVINVIDNINMYLKNKILIFLKYRVNHKF